MVSQLTTSSFLGDKRSDMHCISLDHHTHTITQWKTFYFGTHRVTDHLNKEAGMCWGTSVFTPTIRSLTLFMRSPVALMSFAFSRSFMQSCLYLKHMVSYTLPTHVTSDPRSAPQHTVMNVVLNVCCAAEGETTAAWSHFVSLQIRLVQLSPEGWIWHSTNKQYNDF